ncbi:MAG: beta-ketoacyl synthase chain length factor, partial [Methylococcaceae bacterium]|nr:beta-ketoacyl synthase chain length factor [Methylococcaceae bacterium]
MMKQLFIKSYAICSPDADLLAPFALRGHDIDKNLIPAAMRRRTSMTTRMAISAATVACKQANVDSQTLASVFASLGGEIQVTDALCRLLPDENELLSPTQFHNSVHNTTAGYWAILN